nr:cell adhesion molecule-related/down-regulated by oncogenes-like [Ciona intestinalis]|eukprot:XP_002123163.2 cell adhesion molecule-related/down-regulated by oncogenes-like [Ciona intestinalis]
MWYPRYNGGSPITEYIIEIKKVRAGGWKKLDEFISADSTTFMITGLKRGAAYKFRVTSVNTYGRSRPSSSTDPHYTDFGNQSPKILMSAPEITSVVSTNWSNVQINWSYDEAMSKKLNGYLILYWPSDRRKRKHKKKRLKNALATSYELTSLQSGVLYNVKIQAYNSRGKSPVSNLVVFEMPNNHSSPLVVMQGIRNVDNDEVSDPGHAKNHYGDDSSDNDNKSNNIVVKQQISRRDTAFMIAGGALVFVIIALAASGIIYRRSMTNIKKFLGRKPSNDKITASNGATPNDEYSGLNEGNPPYCECKEVSEHGYEHHHVHSDHILYCDHQECFASAPLWWVRGEERGEFCHIVPANAKRQPPPNPAGGAEATPQTAMVTRTYAGNIAGGYLSHPSQGETTEIIESVETSLIDSVQAPLATEEPPNLTLDQ